MLHFGNSLVDWAHNKRYRISATVLWTGHTTSDTVFRQQSCRLDTPGPIGVFQNTASLR